MGEVRLTDVKRCLVPLLLVWLAACSSGTNDHASRPRPVNVVGVWQPEFVRGFDGVLARPDSRFPPLLTFTARRWLTSDGCNSLSGSYQLGADGGLVVHTRGISTLIGCDNVPIANAVRKASTLRVENHILTLSGSNGRELARFRRGASTRLTGPACHRSAFPVVVRLNQVGGPAPGPPVPLPGTVIATSTNSARCSVRVGADGVARVALRPGVYRVTGRSPQSGDGKYVCTSPQPLTVFDPGSVTDPTSITVECSVK